MRAFVFKSLLVLCLWLTNSNIAAVAHVKWFLSRPESEILKEPKPSLFTHLSLDNLVPVLFAFGLMLLVLTLGIKWHRSKLNERLLLKAQKYEAVVNFFMACMFAVSLIYCGITHTLLVPNFVICSHCPQWLPGAEIILGVLMTVGLCSRLCSLSIFYLAFMALCKHGFDDCLDLMPLLGLNLYFLLAGRNRLSLDYVLKIDRVQVPYFVEAAHLFIRWTMGLGLIILAFNEKLLYPQLAMDILQHLPALNIFHYVGISNAMFILISGLVELLLGFCLLTGSFPRLAIIVLLGIFASTTAVFGLPELFGHASCYAIIVSILMRGEGISPILLFCQLQRDVFDWLGTSRLKQYVFSARQF
jgi:hypothetical protein